MLQFKTTLILIDFYRNIATFMKVKEAFVCKLVFLKSFISLKLELFVLPKIAYIRVTKVKIAYVLIFLLVSKTFRPNKINFWILYII